MKSRWHLRTSKSALLFGSVCWIVAVHAASVDVNQASAEQLQQVKGIGAKTAQRIVAERSRGRFESLAHLSERLSGIGPKTIEKLKIAGLCAGTEQKPCAVETTQQRSAVSPKTRKPASGLPTPEVIQIP